MTTKTMKFEIGSALEYRGDAHLMVMVRVLDSRVSYGKEQYCITPMTGTGTKWVDARNLINQPFSIKNEAGIPAERGIK